MKQNFIKFYLLCFFCLKDNVPTAANHGYKDKGSSVPIFVIVDQGTTTPTTTTTTTTTTTPIPPVTTQSPPDTAGCGMMRVKPNSLIQIQSNNFPYNYFNRDACEWKFLGSDCTLTAYCPCFDIPSSFNCLADYLKISDGFHYNQKFCGDNKPFGKYRSGSDQLTIRFKTNTRETATGFTCFISCTPAGQADRITPDQQTPSQLTCPPAVAL